MNSRMEKTWDAIVVGAGISGLSAAKLLQDSGQDVLVLEANDRVGGRMLNLFDDAVGYTDAGAAYMGPTQDCIYKLSQEMGVDNYQCYEDGECIFYSRGKWRLVSGQTPNSWNPFVNMDLNHFWHLVDEMGKKIPIDRPWDFPEAEEWDSMTVKEWAKKTFWFQLTRDFIAVHCCCGFCTQDTDLSLLYFLWYIKGCGGYLRYSSTEDGAQDRKFVGGSQRICLEIAQRLGKNQVLLGQPVSGFTQNEESVIVSTATGKSYKASYVIAALPPAMVNRIAFTPSLPPLRNQLNQRYPMGSVIKTMMYYKRPFWKDSGYCGSVMADGIISEVKYDENSDGKHHCLVGFLSGDAAKEHCHRTKEERKILIAQRYSVLFKNEEALKPVLYVEKNWMEEPYIGGGYVGFTPPGVITSYCKVLREPVGRVYFAGTETATKWSGYMEGAVQAGQRAAREILHAMGRIQKEDIWKDEAEAMDMPAIPFEETFIERNLPSVDGFLQFTGISLALSVVLGGALWVNRDSFHRLIKGL